MTTASETSDESTDQSSDEGSQTSCIDSDLQELYESFDFQDDNAPAPESGSVVSRPFQFKGIPLYPEARLTSLQSSLFVFQYAIRHSLTTKAFTELVSVHIPPGAAVPKSVYQLKQSFLQAFPDIEAVRHHYCASCGTTLLSTREECDCSYYSPATFITVPLRPQVKQMMEG